MLTAPHVAPLVTYSPIYSTLVVKAGILHRQATVFRIWRPAVVVITIDGFVHMFDTAADVLTTDVELHRVEGITFR